MKNFLITLILMIGFAINCNAEIQGYRATSYAFASVNQYTGKYVWSEWYQCQVNIVIDTNKDMVTIYSKENQRYYITETEGSYTDASGGTQISFKVIDQDRDRGHLRLRKERNGNSQIYIDFADCAWVYNVYRTY